MNVVMISADALRSDKVGELTPNINKLAGTKFLNHITIQNGSGPNQISLFTGLYPKNHGVHENGLRLPDNLKTIAEYFKENEYKTCGSVGSGVLGSVYNFNKGFDTFYDNSKYDKLMHFCSRIGGRRYNLRKVVKKLRLFDVFGTRYNTTNKRVLNWLDENHKKKFFMFIHYFDIHHDTFSKENKNFEIKSREGIYDENVKIVDNAIGKVLDKLKELNVFEDTLIMLTADHGESFEEMGTTETFNKEVGHGTNITEEQFKIPWIIYKKGLILNKGVKVLSRSIDVLPTLLSILKIKKNVETDGEDLSDSDRKSVV